MDQYATKDLNKKPHSYYNINGSIGRVMGIYKDASEEKEERPTVSDRANAYRQLIEHSKQLKKAELN